MSVSYNLDVSGLQNIDNLSEALSNLYQLGNITELFQINGASRMEDLSEPPIPDIFPTGEYIIRDGMYINGMYVYVGSYKGYFRNLFGAGSDGYAWDGFIMVFRGYNNNASPFDAPILDDPNFGFTFGSGAGFLAMRMPFEVNPGASGDATAIADDSSVGLHSLDVYKNQDDITVVGGDLDIRIMTCGFQRINPSVESVPTDMDYVGNIYMGILLRYNGSGPSASGDIVAYEYLPGDMMQITWRANQTGHTDKTNALGRFGIIRELDQEISLSFLQAGDPYTIVEWERGQKPDGTGGPSPTGFDTRAIEFNYFPRRFFDIVCQSATRVAAGVVTESPFYIVGDVSLDTNNDGSIDDTCPILLGCAYPYAFFEQLILDPILIPNAPFISMNAAIATSLAIDPSWLKEDTTIAYNFSGAWACSILIPYEDLEQIDFDKQPLSYIAVNDVTHSGSTYGEIYSFEESPLNGASNVLPLAVETGTFTTTTGIQLPTRWYNKATQFRTFTIEEEDVAKYGQLDVNTGVFYPTTDPTVFPRSVFDPDAQEYIGLDGNYQRYGSFTNPLEPNQPQGTRSGAGYGFLGIRTGTGPIAIMFESGDGKITDDGSGDANYSLTALPEGQNINDNHLTNPTSTTRIIINCGWDNDRDQWLFLTSDTNDFGVISVSSDFSTDSNNIGFLDQTASFTKIAANSDAGFYVPITMSNALDGWVWFGDLDTDTNVRFGIKNANLGASKTLTATFGSTTVTWDAYPDATTNIRRITGTTGRTARVWVDYVLFDGVDSVIATKLKGLGIKVNIENVEWFKRQIIRSGDLNIKAEEIEMWMREQQSQYKEMLKAKERQGRIRKKKSQVSAYREGMEEQIEPDFKDDEVKDYIDTFIPDERPPSPTERKLEKKRKGGYEPKQSSYYDEVFEDEP